MPVLVDSAHGAIDRVDESFTRRVRRGSGQRHGSWLRIDEEVHRAFNELVIGPIERPGCEKLAHRFSCTRYEREPRADGTEGPVRYSPILSIR